MNRPRGKEAWVLAVVVAFFTGAIGFVGLFVDASPIETIASRFTFLVLVYAAGCGLVGALLPRAWYVAALAAWGPLLIAVPALVMLLRGTIGLSDIGFQATAVIAASVATLAFGFIGSRLKQKWVMRAP